MKDSTVGYPKLAVAFAILGIFLGVLKFGFQHWQGYFLGVPFLLIGSIISGLISGKVVFKTTQYSELSYAKRKDKPGTFWFAIFIMSFISWWLISYLNDISTTL